MSQEQEWTSAKGFIRYALGIGALELLLKGRKLKNGRMSPHFFNSGLFNNGSALEIISLGYAGVIAKNFAPFYPAQEDTYLDFDLLYGPPYKGTMLVPTIAMQLHKMGFEDTYFCSSRKEEKRHGEEGVIIGAPIEPGNRVLIVDDVITDGGTKREAVELIQRHGGTVAGLVIAFDRQERGASTESSAQEFTREYGVPVYSIATLADLISDLEERKKLSIALWEKYKNISVETSGYEDCDEMLEMLEMLEQLIAYRQEYGVS